MLHYAGHSVSFQEVPDEVSLVILIADCPHRCKGCHSPELREKTNIDLATKLPELIDEYSDAITCVCFMGDGQDAESLKSLADYVHACGYNTAVYSGNYTAWVDYFPFFDYYKCGPYDEKLGGLDSPSTNQFMLKLTVDIESSNWWFEDITYRFQRSND